MSCVESPAVPALPGAGRVGVPVGTPTEQPAPEPCLLVSRPARMVTMFVLLGGVGLLAGSFEGQWWMPLALLGIWWAVALVGALRHVLRRPQPASTRRLQLAPAPPAGDNPAFG